MCYLIGGSSAFGQLDGSLELNFGQAIANDFHMDFCRQRH